MYRDIFDTSFNIAFTKQKTDRCYLCEEFRCYLCEEFRVRKATNIFTDEDRTKDKAHLVKKEQKKMHT